MAYRNFNLQLISGIFMIHSNSFKIYIYINVPVPVRVRVRKHGRGLGRGHGRGYMCVSLFLYSYLYPWTLYHKTLCQPSLKCFGSESIKISFVILMGIFHLAHILLNQLIP